MITKFVNKGKTVLEKGILGATSTKHYDIMEGTKIPTSVSSKLNPDVPSSFRKRPQKLIYDRNEFYMFRLPSENFFLLGSYDTQDIFGKRRGIEHAPYI